MSALNPETRAVLDAVLEAVNIPHAATIGHERTRAAIIVNRLIVLQVTLQSILDESRPTSPDLDEDLRFMRERLTQFPAEGYVTHEQAHQRLEAGASWMDAVSLDYGQEEGR